jgi:hypothetical protein
MSALFPCTMVFLYLMLQIVFFVKHRFNRVNLFQKVTTLLLCPQVKIVSTSGFASQMNSNICETLSESAGCGAACLSASGSNSTQTLQSILEGLGTSQAWHSFSHHPSCKFIVQLFQKQPFESVSNVCAKHSRRSGHFAGMAFFFQVIRHVHSLRNSFQNNCLKTFTRTLHWYKRKLRTLPTRHNYVGCVVTAKVKSAQKAETFIQPLGCSRFWLFL